MSWDSSLFSSHNVAPLMLCWLLLSVFVRDALSQGRKEISNLLITRREEEERSTIKLVLSRRGFDWEIKATEVVMITIPFIVEIEEFCRPGNVYKLICRWYSTIRDIKNQLNSLTHQPLSRLHLFHSSKPYELNNNTTLHDLGIEKEGYSMKLAVDYLNDNKFTLEVVNNALVDEKCRQTIKDVRIGLDVNKVPGKTDILDSTGGVYFMRSCKGANVAVFKPRDEEQGMENNPKGYTSQSGEQVGLRPYFKPGHGCLREFAAYIFDVDNFCGVPPTSLVHCEHPAFHYPQLRNGTSGKPFPKFGSLQDYVHGESFEDIGASKLSDFEVQKIALLDLRILNCDRNSANILAVRKLPSPHNSRHNSDVGVNEDFNTDDEFDCFDTHLNVEGGIEFELVPIDHGYAFPPRLLINDYDWTWFNYPQVKKPVVPEIKEYIKNLDVDKAIRELRESVPDIPLETMFLLRLAHLLIKEGIAAGLTLREIASLVARLDDEEPSKLEQVISTAEDNAFSNILMKSGRVQYSSRSDNAKRPGEFGLCPPGVKRFSSPTLDAIADRERSDSSGSSGSDCDTSDHEMQRMASIFSATGYPSSRSPVSVVRESSPQGDVPRSSSSESLEEEADSSSRGAALQASSSGNLKPTAKTASVANPSETYETSKLSRVASFAGFSSASLYDSGKQNSGDSTSLQRERRKAIALTAEFKHLKWKLASDGLKATLNRSRKSTY